MSEINPSNCKLTRKLPSRELTPRDVTKNTHDSKKLAPEISAPAWARRRVPHGPAPVPGPPEVRLLRGAALRHRRPLPPPVCGAPAQGELPGSPFGLTFSVLFSVFRFLRAPHSRPHSFRPDLLSLAFFVSTPSGRVVRALLNPQGGGWGVL